MTEHIAKRYYCTNEGAVREVDEPLEKLSGYTHWYRAEDYEQLYFRLHQGPSRWETWAKLCAVPALEAALNGERDAAMRMHEALTRVPWKLP